MKIEIENRVELDQNNSAADYRIEQWFYEGDLSTSAGGAAEGSQGQALGAQPLDQVLQTQPRPEGAEQHHQT